ncbi:MAG: metallophosphoesterase [Vicinamibacterales bacterium]
MRIAALCDIHGNLPALEAVLDEVRAAGVDAIVVGGDVLPGPMPAECLAALAALACPVHYLRGNGDRVSLAARRGEDVSGEVPAAFVEAVRWSGTAISEAAAARLDAWPATVTLTVHGLGEVLFCHATPRSDVEIITRLTTAERLAPAFAGVEAAVVVCGHTHMPFDRTVNGLRVVNAGSVGMPFGRPGADWLLLGPDVTPRHTAYDLAAAAARVRASAYPQREAFAAGSILAPPSDEDMLKAFAAAELK